MVLPMESDDDDVIAVLNGFNFNPRSRMGSDAALRLLSAVSKIFQSTLPYGERLAALASFLGDFIFQSTLPYGERLSASEPLEGEIKISIHAPVWGATIRSMTLILLPEFQSTLPYGERPSSQVSIPPRIFISIHAPVWGATAKVHKISAFTTEHIYILYTFIFSAYHVASFLSTFTIHFLAFSGANPPAFLCSLYIRTRILMYQQH